MENGDVMIQQNVKEDEDCTNMWNVLLWTEIQRT